MSDDHTHHLSTPGDIAATVPYLLGFHPQHSLVVLGLSQRIITLGMRIDLPSGPADETFRHHLATSTVQLIHSDITTCVLVAYGAAEPARTAVSDAASLFDINGIDLAGVMRVDGTTVWPLTRSGTAHSDGTSFDPSTSTAVFAATVAGRAALPDRDALVAQLTPSTGAEREAVIAATADARRFVDDIAHKPQWQGDVIVIGADDGDDTGEDITGAIRAVALLHVGHGLLRDMLRAYRDGRPASDREVALLSVLLTEPAMLDAAVRHIKPDPWQTAMWIDIVRRADAPLVTAPANLAAGAALGPGDGGLASCAVARAIETDPGDRLAGLITELVQLGVEPAAILTVLNR